MLSGSIILATKFNDDECDKNELYSKISGIPLREINELEKKTLKFLEYNLYVDPEYYWKYKNELKNKVNKFSCEITWA